MLKQIYMDRGNNYTDLSKYNEALQVSVLLLKVFHQHLPVFFNWIFSSTLIYCVGHLFFTMGCNFM